MKTGGSEIRDHRRADRAGVLGLHDAGREAAVSLREGVYAGLSGPQYETPAEVRMLRTLGAHAVGMSTVLEVIALWHMGVRVSALSCITNMAAGMTAQPPIPLWSRTARTVSVSPIATSA